MHRIPASVELEGPEKDFIITKVIKEEFVDTTIEGRPRFRIKSIVQRLKEIGYDINGYEVYRFIERAKTEGKNVFEKTANRPAKYVCDFDIFTRFYDNKEAIYLASLSK